MKNFIYIFYFILIKNNIVSNNLKEIKSFNRRIYIDSLLETFNDNKDKIFNDIEFLFKKYILKLFIIITFLICILIFILFFWSSNDLIHYRKQNNLLIIKNNSTFDPFKIMYENNPKNLQYINFYYLMNYKNLNSKKDTIYKDFFTNTKTYYSEYFKNNNEIFQSLETKITYEESKILIKRQKELYQKWINSNTWTERRQAYLDLMEFNFNHIFEIPFIKVIDIFIIDFVDEIKKKNISPKILTVNDDKKIDPIIVENNNKVINQYPDNIIETYYNHMNLSKIIEIDIFKNFIKKMAAFLSIEQEDLIYFIYCVNSIMFKKLNSSMDNNFKKNKDKLLELIPFEKRSWINQ